MIKLFILSCFTVASTVLYTVSELTLSVSIDVAGNTGDYSFYRITYCVYFILCNVDALMSTLFVLLSFAFARKWYNKCCWCLNAKCFEIWKKASAPKKSKESENSKDSKEQTITNVTMKDSMDASIELGSTLSPMSIPVAGMNRGTSHPTQHNTFNTNATANASVILYEDAVTVSPRGLYHFGTDLTVSMQTAQDTEKKEKSMSTLTLQSPTSSTASSAVMQELGTLNEIQKKISENITRSLVEELGDPVTMEEAMEFWK